MEDRSITVSGADVEKAVERGLARLGLTKAEVRIEILDQGSRGILGIGSRDAVVRLQPIVGREPVPLQEADDLVEDEREELLQEADDQIREEEEEFEELALSQDELAKIAQQALAELLSKMGIESEVTIRQAEHQDEESAPVTLDVLGRDLDVLIGRQGEVLNALQYITRLIVSREVEHWANVVVDVEHYKQRRANSLEQLAERIAERVARTKQPVALEPMPPNERRVIHLALHDHPAVTTQSVGKGDSRKVTIIPRR